MPPLNWARILLVGFLAGVWICVSGFSFAHFVLRSELEAMMSRRPSPPGPVEFAIHLGTRLAFGIFIVWMYAILSSRYGPGVATAARAALAIWLMVTVTYALNLSAAGIFTPKFAILGTLWSYIEMFLASLIAFRLYCS